MNFQTEKLGTPLGKTLRVHADSARVQRRQRIPQTSMAARTEHPFIRALERGGKRVTLDDLAEGVASEQVAHDLHAQPVGPGAVAPRIRQQLRIWQRAPLWALAAEQADGQLRHRVGDQRDAAP
jgi:hypothetical protein